MLRGLLALACPAVLAVLALPACSNPSTAARLIFDFDPAIEMEQIRLEVVNDGAVVATADLPERPEAALRSGLDIVVLFDDALGGESVDFYAAGLHAGAEVARGRTSFALVKDKTLRAHVTLEATACDAGGCC